ncbi:hypothetical protein A2U01_0083355, partial [Trifolium medium]|nr:hypothetical protein [Trifolium medium]
GSQHTHPLAAPPCLLQLPSPTPLSPSLLPPPDLLPVKAPPFDAQNDLAAFLHAPHP